MKKFLPININSAKSMEYIDIISYAEMDSVSESAFFSSTGKVVVGTDHDEGETSVYSMVMMGMYILPLWSNCVRRPTCITILEAYRIISGIRLTVDPPVMLSTVSLHHLNESIVNYKKLEYLFVAGRENLYLNSLF